MADDPKRWIIPFFLIVFVYALFPTKTYYWDGVLFSLNVEGVQQNRLPVGMLFHPNHLLYSAAGYVFYGLLVRLPVSIRALTMFQAINILLSGACAVLIYTLASKIARSRAIATLACVLFAGGATWWRFSTDANSYITTIFLLVLGLFFALREPQRMLPTAICHTAAMLIHQLAVFAYAPFLAAIFLDTAAPRIIRVKRAAAYCAATSVTVAIVYFAVFRMAGPQNRTFTSWIVSYSPDTQKTHSLYQLVVAYPLSYLKLLVGGRLGLIKEFWSIPVAISLACSLFLVFWAARLLRKPSGPALTSFDRRTQLVLLLWVLPYLVFFAWWEPGAGFYKLFVWPPLVLLAAGCVVRIAFLRTHISALRAFVLAIIAWNFGAFIYVHSRAGADPVYSLARTIDRELPKNAKVYYRAFNPDDWYLAYFAPGRTWLSLPNSRVDQLTNRNGTTCLETTALDFVEEASASDLSHLADHALHWSLVNGQHNVRLQCLKTRAQSD
jgi:hypothetical protein